MSPSETPSVSSETIETYIVSNVVWADLPHDVQTMLGSSPREYEKRILDYSVRNQLKHKGNIVRHVKKSAQEYYELVLKYSTNKLMIYPYHLLDALARGLRVTPFEYYIIMMQNTIKEEKSYDSLPNFTAADAVRLLGIGRNQYIDIMNESRSFRKLFRRRTLQDILPQRPVDVHFEPWFMLCAGCILDADIKQLEPEEKEIVDRLVDGFPLLCGLLDRKQVGSLYHRGIVYIDVPISEDDYVYVPTLDGFVMNRVQNDYLEATLYKLFVSIDGQMSVRELADVIGVSVELAKNGVSLLCRLNFAKKRVTGLENVTLHRSWQSSVTKSKTMTASGSASLMDESIASTLADLSSSLVDDDEFTPAPTDQQLHADDATSITSPTSTLSTPALDPAHKRVGLVVDYSLSAYLMMGNLSSVRLVVSVNHVSKPHIVLQSLKQHAVTLFEVGKLSDDVVGIFAEELQNVKFFAEGDAQNYSEHARTLLHTILTIRTSNEIDLIRGESLLSLDHNARQRMIQKSYKMLIAMAPLSTEACALSQSAIPHIGGSVVELSSPWFRLYLYELIKDGPSSILLPMGTCLREMPPVLQTRRLLVTCGNHEPTTIFADNALLHIGEHLLTSSVFVQEYSDEDEGRCEAHNIAFPFADTPAELQNERHFCNHPSVKCLREKLGLDSRCGYITMLHMRTASRKSAAANSPSRADGEEHQNSDVTADEDAKSTASASLHASFYSTAPKDPRKLKTTRVELAADESFEDFVVFDVLYGIPLFDEALNAEVCKRLISHNILTPANSDEVLYKMKDIGDSVREYVASNRDSDYETPFGKAESNFVPLPTRTVTFSSHQLLST